MSINLTDITLIGIDTSDLVRLQLAADICQRGCSFGAVKLLTTAQSSDPRVIRIPTIRSKKGYSRFITKNLAKYVETKYALVFQHDGFILNPDAWTDEFLQYDYIGAPWYHLGELRVGNGGFSLRSKRLLDFIAHNYRAIGGSLHPEDIWISRDARPVLERAGMRFAPEELASRFSKEGNRRGVSWDGQFGFHGIGYTDISKWIAQHPEYKKPFGRKLDDFATFMKQYPVYDGTVHVLDFLKRHMNNYRSLASGEKTYEARKLDLGNGPIQQGHTIIFKRSGVSFKKVPIPAFSRRIRSVERFNTLKELRQKYPDLHVSYPSFRSDAPDYDRWSIERFAPILGDLAYPNEGPYEIYWFAEEKQRKGT